MDFLTAIKTDIGTVRQSNQDSAECKIFKSANEKAALAIVCDGVGGFENGEFASQSVVSDFVSWFETVFPTITERDSFSEIQKQIEALIKITNDRLLEISKRENLKMGTTLSCVLILDDGRYLIAQIGDSRVYLINNVVKQLTVDQTIVNLELEQGLITKEEAKHDKRTNVLYQAIGTKKILKPVFMEGKANIGDVFLLCSDGFCHFINNDEIINNLQPNKIKDTNNAEMLIQGLIDICKKRGEQDNITATLIKLQEKSASKKKLSSRKPKNKKKKKIIIVFIILFVTIAISILGVKLIEKHENADAPKKSDTKGGGQ